MACGAGPIQQPRRALMYPYWLMKKIAASLVLVACFSTGVYAQSRFEKSAERKRELTSRVVWPTHEPVMFSLRRGGHGDDLIETYARQHDPENIKLQLAAGIKYGRLHFYKGFGIDYERTEIDKSAAMADFMHQNGMKVSLYVAGTMFVESFYREIPEAINWEQRDQNNRPVYYSDTQTYRHFACPNEPLYREYIKKVLRIGVERFKADQIFFDNVFLQPEPKSCRCDRCKRAFKEYLRKKYPTKEAAFRRFGYPDVDWLVINDWDVFNRPEDLTSIDDPVLQEWEGFRAETVARDCREYYDFIKGLNPHIAVGFNLKGLYGLNRIWRNGVWQPLFAGKIDFSPFDVGGMEAHLDRKTGAVIAEIRSFKMARTLGFAYETGGDSLEFANFMAFNPQKKIDGYGYQGSPNHSRGEERCFSAEAEFFREYSSRYFNETNNVADVAVLRTWPSMAYSLVSTLVPTILVEQTLIQHQVPFDIIFDEQMDRISRYKAIVLPGQESLSDAWVKKLTEYANAGGTVVFTDNTADYNDWRERRHANPLLELVGIRRAFVPGARRRAGGEPRPAGDITVKPLGKGKLVYIPRTEPATGGGDASATTIGIAGDETSLNVPGFVRSGSFAASNWVLPKNHVAIYRAIADNLPQPLSLTTEAPLTTVMELLNRAPSKETIVHAINFDPQHPPAAFTVRVRKQYPDLKTASVTLLSSEFDDPKPLTFTEENGSVVFTMPTMKVHEMAVIANK